MITHSNLGLVLRVIGTAALALMVSAPASPRLYIFDFGVIHTTNGDAYSLK
jgi:hypothetical protein